MKNRSVFVGLSLIGLGASLLIIPAVHPSDGERTTQRVDKINEFDSNNAILSFGDQDTKKSEKPTFDLETKENKKKRNSDMHQQPLLAIKENAFMENNSVEEDTEVGKLFAAMSGRFFFGEKDDSLG